jgi:hypothetical protein
MESPTLPDVVIQTLATGVQQIVSEILQIKADFQNKLAVITEQSSSLQRLVESMGTRLSRFERLSEDENDMASIRSPETQVNRRKLKIEIQMLQEKIRVLSDENAKLRNGKPAPFFPIRGVPFEPSISDDNRSLSSIQLADRSTNNKKPPIGQRIREFRLDSAPSQSFKPNNSLLSDPRVARMFNNDVFSSKNSVKEVTSLKTGRLHELGAKLKEVTVGLTVPNLECTPSLDGKRPAIARVETPKGNRKPFPKNLTILNRRPPKPTQEKEVEEVGKTMATSADERAKAISGIKNFGDFRTLLKQMKDTINLSNYSLFNADVDNNLESLQTLFRDYSDLQDKIDALYLRYAQHCVESPGLSMSPERQLPFGDGKDFGVYRCERYTDIEIALSVKNLKDNIRLVTHRERLAEVQGNPSHLESFLYRLKAEFDANSREFERITRQIGPISPTDPKEPEKDPVPESLE